MCGVLSSVPSDASAGQMRFKTQPLKWGNDKLFRRGTANMMQPWELRNDPDVIHGDFGLICAAGGHVTERQLENVMAALKTHVKPKDFIITVRDDVQILPMSIRPQGARMGKGVGDNIQWVMKVRAGTVLFDVQAMAHTMITWKSMREFFAPVQHMIGVRTQTHRKGIINQQDDISYDTAGNYMDKLYHRRLQDAYPQDKWKMAYRLHANAVPDAPWHNLKKQQQPWYVNRQKRLLFLQPSYSLRTEPSFQIIKGGPLVSNGSSMMI